LKIEDYEDQQLSTDDFIVPFEQNPWFTGRREFLETLKIKMFDQAPKKHNHRIALYGMGGIGKTQTALEYVYTNRDLYERIYWITAVDQASLLSGYLKIAVKAGLKSLFHLKPVEIAEGVLSWLRQKQSWLIVIDNLDDIDIVTGFLPQNGPQKHTLITTRNPNSGGIPAEGLELPLLNAADSVDLLSTLSKIDVIANSLESIQAAQIVQELGYLPLGIEQAAAYIREVAGSFADFLDDYQKNRKDVYHWVSQGYRSYSHSVATTWFMSFNVVRKNNSQAATLFQILSFLNPDGVLIDFL
jgi:NB-ARC domain